jgi:hypothetical protein
MKILKIYKFRHHSLISFSAVQPRSRKVLKSNFRIIVCVSHASDLPERHCISYTFIYHYRSCYISSHWPWISYISTRDFFHTWKILSVFTCLGKQKSSQSVVSRLETPDYFINFSLFLLLEENHERPVTLTLMMCSWMDWRVKPDLCSYVAVGCSGLEWIGPAILAHLRRSLEKFRFWVTSFFADIFQYISNLRQ